MANDEPAGKRTAYSKPMKDQRERRGGKAGRAPKRGGLKYPMFPSMKNKDRK